MPGSAHDGGDQDLGLVRFGAVVAEVQPDVPVVAPRINIRMGSATLVLVCRILVIKEDELLLNAHAQYLLTFAGEPLQIKRFVDRQQNLSVRMSILSKLYKFQLIKVLKVLKRFLQLTTISIDTILYLELSFVSRLIGIYQRNYLGTIDRTTLMIKISIFTLTVKSNTLKSFMIFYSAMSITVK